MTCTFLTSSKSPKIDFLEFSSLSSFSLRPSYSVYFAYTWSLSLLNMSLSSFESKSCLSKTCFLDLSSERSFFWSWSSLFAYARESHSSTYFSFHLCFCFASASILRRNCFPSSSICLAYNSFWCSSWLILSSRFSFSSPSFLDSLSSKNSYCFKVFNSLSKVEISCIYFLD